MPETQNNITEVITQTINSIFTNLFSSIDNTLYSILDDIVFVDENILKDKYFENIFGTSSSNGIILIANSILIGFILYYCIQLIFSLYNDSKLQSPYKFIFKIIIICIFVNSSYFVCEKVLFFNSSISLAIRGIGESLYNKNICFSELIIQLNSLNYINNITDFLTFDGIIKFLSSFGLLNLIFIYSLRYIMIKVFVLIFPFAILTLSSENTSWIFKSWLRCFLSLLLIQQLISIIFLIVFSLEFSSNTFSKFMYIGSIYALLNANSYIREIIGGISTDISADLSNLSSILKK